MHWPYQIGMDTGDTMDTYGHISQLKIQLDEGDDLQTSFDRMYAIMYELLDWFYPEREITITTGDPHFITASVKAMLRRN